MAALLDWLEGSYPDATARQSKPSVPTSAPCGGRPGATFGVQGHAAAAPPPQSPSRSSAVCDLAFRRVCGLSGEPRAVAAIEPRAAPAPVVAGAPARPRATAAS